jgi:hypothetical protein
VAAKFKTVGGLGVPVADGTKYRPPVGTTLAANIDLEKTLALARYDGETDEQFRTRVIGYLDLIARPENTPMVDPVIEIETEFMRELKAIR